MVYFLIMLSDNVINTNS